MKTPIKDVLMVTAALLITGSSAYAMQPPNVTQTASTTKVVKVEQKIKPASQPEPTPAPVVAPEPVEDPAPAETSVVEAPVASEPIYTGSHEDWMAAAGIAQSDYAAVDYIISHESSWNPDATEPNSGAHGLPQALPYSKTGCGWSDPICQLQWASIYAKDRYGGWWGAYNQWTANRWW
jgi:hypothetical protein